jgi:chromosome segregation ATPase
LSNQNIRDKEQLLSEKGESFRKAEEKFQHDQRALQIRIATAEATMAADNEAFHETITSTKEWFNSVISGIDTVCLNFFDNHKNIENRISNISHELQVAKEYINKMNKERRQLQTDKNHLLEELQGKREEELTLGEKVEKLEAKARKGESEKMIVTTIVVELKKRVEELEKLMEEKEEGMLNLGEEKREAIRQLCLQIDYHRERNDYLKEFISKTRRGQRAV